MTKEQTKKLIDDLVNSYLSFGRELTEIQRGNLLDMFLNWDFKRACRALSNLDKEMPPISTNGFLPDLKDIKLFYEKIADYGCSRLSFCPCCGCGDERIVIFKHKSGKYAGQEMAHDCRCWLDSGRPPRTTDFKKQDFYICDNLCCMNPDKSSTILVAEGQGEYWKIRLKNCKFNPVVTEYRLPREN